MDHLSQAFLTPTSRIQRLYHRSAERNLEDFLSFNWATHRLSLTDRKVGGVAVPLLAAVSEQNLSFKEKIAAWWYGSFEVNRIGEYLKQQANTWALLLEQEPKKLILLEKQFAQFERICSASDVFYKFNNPFKKNLCFQIHYPPEIGREELKTLKFLIPFDCLTTTEQLASKINQILLQRYPVRFPLSETWEGGMTSYIDLVANLTHLFREALYPSELPNPQVEKRLPYLSHYSVTFKNPDFKVANLLLLEHSQNKIFPQVYQLGIVKGYQFALNQDGL